MTAIEWVAFFNAWTAAFYVVAMPTIILSANAAYSALPDDVRRFSLLRVWGWSACAVGFFVACGNHHMMMAVHYESGLDVTTAALVNDGVMALTTTVAAVWVGWWISRYIYDARHQ